MDVELERQVEQFHQADRRVERLRAALLRAMKDRACIVAELVGTGEESLTYRAAGELLGIPWSRVGQLNNAHYNYVRAEEDRQL